MACEDVERERVVLAQNPSVGSVAMCGCGVIHMSLGAISMRLSPDVLVEMSRMLQMASHTLLQQSRALEMASEMVH